MKQKLTLLILLLLVASYPAESSYAREQGFRFGRFLLSPKLNLGLGLDSNPLFSVPASPTDGFLLAIPGFSLVGVGRRLEVETVYNFELRRYLDTTIQNSDNHYATARLGLKGNRWRIQLRNDFKLTTDPADAEILERLKRLRNEASLEFIYASHSKDMEFSFGYKNIIQDFQGDLNELGSFENQLLLSSTVNISSFFRFLPKTTLDGSIEYQRLSFPEVVTPGIRTNGNAFAGELGIVGKLTAKSSITLRAGVKHLNFDLGPSTTNVTGEVTGKYELRATEFSLGYKKSLTESQFTNFTNTNAIIYSAIWHNNTERLIVRLAGNLSFLDYSGPTSLANSQNRTDTVFRNELHISYKLTRIIAPYCEYKLSIRDSNASNPLTGAASADFQQHIAIIGVELSY